MTSANPAAWDQLRGFAAVQAQEANAAVRGLDEPLDGAGSRAERVAGFEAAGREVAQWRVLEAGSGVAAGNRSGRHGSRAGRVSQVMHEQLRIATPPAARPVADAGVERPAAKSSHRREASGR